MRHRPSGEEWVVAYQDGEYMAWCGWPEGEARAADCEVIRTATDAEHLALLLSLTTGTDKRARLARAALEALPAPAWEPPGTLTCESCGRRVGLLLGGFCSTCLSAERRLDAVACERCGRRTNVVWGGLCSDCVEKEPRP